MKTVDSLDAIKWHLENNVLPKLTKKTVGNILDTLDKLNKCEIELDDTITPDTDCTVSEMLEDLNIEVE